MRIRISLAILLVVAALAACAAPTPTPPTATTVPTRTSAPTQGASAQEPEATPTQTIEQRFVAGIWNVESSLLPEGAKIREAALFNHKEVQTDFSENGITFLGEQQSVLEIIDANGRHITYVNPIYMVPKDSEDETSLPGFKITGTAQDIINSVGIQTLVKDSGERVYYSPFSEKPRLIGYKVVDGKLSLVEVALQPEKDVLAKTSEGLLIGNGLTSFPTEALNKLAISARHQVDENGILTGKIEFLDLLGHPIHTITEFNYPQAPEPGEDAEIILSDQLIALSDKRIKELLADPENEGKIICPVNADKETVIKIVTVTALKPGDSSGDAILITNFRESNQKDRLVFNPALEPPRIFSKVGPNHYFIFGDGLTIQVSNPAKVNITDEKNINAFVFGDVLATGFSNHESTKYGVRAVSIFRNVTKDGKPKGFAPTSSLMLMVKNRWVVRKELIEKN